MDGFAVIDHIRQQKLEPRLPIVIVSASALEDEQQVAFERGADGFLSKPVNERDLFAMVQKLTGVEYRHANYQPEKAPEIDAQAKEARVSVALPSDLVDALCAAARRGDIAAIDEYVTQAVEHDQATGQHLRGLADSFDYDALVVELEASGRL